MEKSARAKICWVSPETKEPTNCPTVTKYITVAQFEGETKDILDEAWSLVIEFDGVIDEANCIYANIYYLSDLAPINNLKSGNRFTLFSGLAKPIATGIIL